ncbi:MAG: glycosyltransferase family 9 protein [Bacteroidetes bacterium]|nr:glycosyltransferase family 9 protein [Bacteroidota bacterium]MBS1630876.1 glycosyltransferase family 9 protein [Bacteroidota bacterium]
MQKPHSILISRTDSIGDVMLTLPLATILKQSFPGIRIGFLGKKYTKPVIACCSAVDEFVDCEDFLSGTVIGKNWDVILHVFPRKDIAWKAFRLGIPIRIGTSSRPYHWLSCNRLVKLHRKHSELHEAQLNTCLLRPLGIDSFFSKDQLGTYYSLDRLEPLASEFSSLLEPGKFHVILHPKSQGSAREWGLENFASLARMLAADNIQVFISGTEKERSSLAPLLKQVGQEVVDISGRMSLSQFIAFIATCDALVAASTGPLHIAAALGKRALGIYPSIRPMHAGRWGPLGPKAIAFSEKESCEACRNAPENCHCIREISVSALVAALKEH